MNYFDVKAKSDNIKSQLHSLDQERKTIEQEREDVVNALKALEVSRSSDRKRQEQADKEAFIRKSCKPVEEKLASVRKNIDSLESEHKAFVKEFENTYDQRLQEAEELAEVTLLQEQIQETMQYSNEIISERFFGTLEQQLDDASTVKLEADDLIDAIDYFEKVNHRMTLITQNTCNRLIERVIEFFSCFDTTNLNGSNKLFVLGVFVVVFLLLFLAKKIAPLIVFGLLIIVVFNVFRSYFVYLTVLAIKTIKDNLDRVKSTLREKAVQELEEEKQSELTEFERVHNLLKIKEDKLQQACEKTSADAGNSFIFDDKRLQEEYNTKKKQLEAKQSDIQRRAITVSTKINDLKSAGASMAEELTASMDDLLNSVLDPNKVGTSFTLDPKFFLGIDEKDGFLYFDFPMAHCFFTYQDTDIVLQFIRLILFQLRQKLHTSVFSCYVYDLERGGDSLAGMFPDPSSLKSPEEKSSAELAFNVFIAKDAITNSIKEIASDLQSKQQRVTRAFNNINSYNEAMVASDSLPMDFIFLFVLTDDMEIMRQETTKQILKIGDKVGVFVFYFVSKVALSTSGNQGKELVNSFRRCYDLSASKVQTVSATFLQDLIKK